MERTAVPKALQAQLGDEATEGLVELFNKQQAQMTDDIVRAVVRELEPRFAAIEARLDNCATKDDLRDFPTRNDLLAFATKDDLRNGLRECATKDDLRSFATKDDLDRLGSRLDGRLDTLIETFSNYRADMVRWMFLFWVGQTFILLAYLRGSQ